MTKQETKIFKKSTTFVRLMKLVYVRNKLPLILVLIFMVVSTIANVSGLNTLQNVMDEALRMYEVGSTDFSGVIKLLGMMVLFYVINISFTFAHLRLMVHVSQNSLVHLRTSLFDHMMDLPLKYFDSNKHGDIMSRFTNDVDATRQMVSQSLPQLTVSLMLMVGYFIAMVAISWVLGLFTLVFAVILIGITRIISKRTRKYFNAQQKNTGLLNGYIEEMIEGQKVVKVFRHEQEAIEGFGLLNEKVKDSARISMTRSGMLIPISINLGFLGFALTAIFGGMLVLSGYLSVSGLVLYLIFTRQFMGPVNQMSQQLNFVQMALAGASRVFEVMDLEKEVDEGHVTLTYAKYENKELIESDEPTDIWAWNNKGTLIRLKGDVRLDHVDFGYSSDKLVLKDISVFAKPGQKIAFVGSTGAGKTTITNLINRFYEINNGIITFDGIDIKDIKKSALRKSLGIVLQDTHLFQTTVRENIRYGKLDATDEDVIVAAKLANAHEFILKLPNGYDTIITDDGANLSQGQRQLLSIARAAISNPPVLILDEATSSIDTYTEKLIQDGMDRLMTGRTVFVIAHRLSTIKNSKAIILLEDGNIIERGSHNELIDLKGTYYELFTGSFELE
ncbi:ABC transporter ATP-binding protein [Acholeplasma laidlawii]|uniref:ABC-type transport system, permease and ATP-binding components n=1 Tax=Acholeplasma laidlawii (strain PG-8A) TaxID=441768 RepID=A9NFA9_ACHLI|nr:ABC transporter ATP-binding protein [Acholeplasma laidlawii]ABX81039.1 ABC-type transport system, permease and ATP-binding components [Acholeplasma laidlawii PG-8A]NWH10393.1 ABC transporter ATP-binding protein [Acholeplasma laidlawii]OED28534.1 ABC transporter [Acholeplasma laidlawii]OWU86956.1 ABC transporter [Acholeplasma laidlawii]RED20131.1 ATP-binding cassette subfamily B protein [Acholeplasma laidlawii]